MALANTQHNLAVINAYQLLINTYQLCQNLGCLPSYAHLAYAIGVRTGNIAAVNDFINEISALNKKAQALGLSEADLQAVLADFIAGGLDSAEKRLSQDAQKHYQKIAAEIDEFLREAETEDDAVAANLKIEIQELAKAIAAIRQQTQQQTFSSDATRAIDAQLAQISFAPTDLTEAQKQALTEAEANANTLLQDPDFLDLRTQLEQYDALTTKDNTQTSDSVEHHLNTLAEKIKSNATFPQLMTKALAIITGLLPSTLVKATPTAILAHVSNENSAPPALRLLTATLLRIEGFRALTPDLSDGRPPFLAEKLKNLMGQSAEDPQAVKVN